MSNERKETPSERAQFCVQQADLAMAEARKCTDLELRERFLMVAQLWMVLAIQNGMFF